MKRAPLKGIRAIVADDASLLREGVVLLIQEAGVEVVGQAGDGEDLLRKTRAHKPDIVLTDVRMPPTHTNEGLVAAIKIREEMPDVGVLVVSQDVDDSYATELLANNAAGFGYLLKDRVINIEQFFDALERVANGGSALDPIIVSQLMGRYQRRHPLDVLTPREREVLGLMAEGRTNRAIAQRLVISDRAAEKHVTNIFSKLDLEQKPDDHRRVLAVLEYIRRV